MANKVFEGLYPEELLYEDLMDDIFIVFDDLPNLPGHPQGFKPGAFRVIIYQEL
jgi:hypothetical protein